MDPAPENKGMTPQAGRAIEAVAQAGVCLFYVSPSEEAVILPDFP